METELTGDDQEYYRRMRENAWNIYKFNKQAGKNDDTAIFNAIYHTGLPREMVVEEIEHRKQQGAS